ncbi:hypothetical protein GCK72_019528 [Caenorhabditis remanei]|uniref:DUF38 domain-containing protein n=1 Tax=Caenorhabditis remanei TaxID=31234 RepID=A0A6A5GE70_CAERE|nr:hypothetical protein GCK72_019528 [Caenorhabditis remanei]KAF1752973.1 hypothetical protein GCK72_019528 [Caenorhabditis remanei]
MVPGDTFWKNLPTIFKQTVIEHLDYKSRCCLRKCSKSDRELEEQCPVSLEKIILKLGFNKTVRMMFEECDSELDVFYPASDVIQDFCQIFRNPRSKCSILEINGFARGSDPLTTDIIQELAEILLFSQRVKIEKLKFWVNVFHAEEIFVNLIKSMDPKHLKSIILCHEISKNGMELLAATEHWARLKKIGFGEIEDPGFDSFTHLEKIRFAVKSINPRDVWKLVQNFVTANRPNGSYFDISITHDANVPSMLKYFQERNIELKNEPIRSGDLHKYIHTQRFKFTKVDEGNTVEELMLILKMNNWSVYGYICKTDRYS